MIKIYHENVQSNKSWNYHFAEPCAKVQGKLARTGILSDQLSALCTEAQELPNDAVFTSFWAGTVGARSIAPHQLFDVIAALSIKAHIRNVYRIRKIVKDGLCSATRDASCDSKQRRTRRLRAG